MDSLAGPAAQTREKDDILEHIFSLITLCVVLFQIDRNLKNGPTVAGPGQ